MYVLRCRLSAVKAVRKQFYITAENERKLKRLAARERCTEAALVRKAIDQLDEAEPTQDEKIDQHLRKLGYEVPKRRMSDAAFDRHLREMSKLLGGVDLVQAVWEDREGR
jgi:hypothetical protein